MEKDSRSYAIIGAAMEVHRELGAGFLEAVYQAALSREFALRGIPFAAEVSLPVTYKGSLLPCAYVADFVCYESIVVETKAVSALAPAHQAQILNQLKATGYDLGLLINFGSPSLEHKRMVKSTRPEASEPKELS